MTPDLIGGKPTGLEKEVATEFGGSVQSDYLGKVSTARTFSLIYEGTEYLEVFRQLNLVKRKGETNAECFKRLVAEAYERAK